MLGTLASQKTVQVVRSMLHRDHPRASFQGGRHATHSTTATSRDFRLRNSRTQFQADEVATRI
jgi:hypothetical protein